MPKATEMCVFFLPFYRSRKKHPLLEQYSFTFERKVAKDPWTRTYHSFGTPPNTASEGLFSASVRPRLKATLATLQTAVFTTLARYANPLRSQVLLILLNDIAFPVQFPGRAGKKLLYSVRVRCDKNLR